MQPIRVLPEKQVSEEVVKVFVSYSWDSEEHKNKVLALSDSLRRDGMECQIDRYHVSPPKGWYLWMMDQLEESDFVLVVCTEKYNLRYQNREERGQGRGVTWEGGLIIEDLYKGQGMNDKFIPVLLSPEGEEYIPRSLQAYTVYRLWGNDDYDLNKQGDYQNLYRYLTKQPAYVAPKVGERRRLLSVNKAPSNVGDYGEIIQPQDPTRETVDQLKAKKIEEQPVSANELASDRGVDYTHLRDLLQAGEWEAADQETAKRMCEVMGRQQEGWLKVEDIQNFPFTDLRTIDQLWVTCSKGRFGFSIQKHIWVEVGKDYTKFGERVGWRVSKTIIVERGILWMKRAELGEQGQWLKYNQLTFSMDAPKGHLPPSEGRFRVFWGDIWGWGFGEGGEWSLFSRAEICRV